MCYILVYLLPRQRKLHEEGFNEFHPWGTGICAAELPANVGGPALCTALT